MPHQQGRDGQHVSPEVTRRRSLGVNGDRKTSRAEGRGLIKLTPAQLNCVMALCFFFGAADRLTADRGRGLLNVVRGPGAEKTNSDWKKKGF